MLLVPWADSKETWACYKEWAVTTSAARHLATVVICLASTITYVYLAKLSGNSRAFGFKFSLFFFTLEILECLLVMVTNKTKKKDDCFLLVYLAKLTANLRELGFKFSLFYQFEILECLSISNGYPIKQKKKMIVFCFRVFGKIECKLERIGFQVFSFFFKLEISKCLSISPGYLLKQKKRFFF